MFHNHDLRSAKCADRKSRTLRHPQWQRRGAAGWLAIICALMLYAAPPSLAAESPAGLSGVVNINTASSQELQLLPGVGEKRAEAIIDIRKSKGGFQSVDELVAVKGLGEAMLERMRRYVTLKGKTTARRI